MNIIIDNLFIVFVVIVLIARSVRASNKKKAGGQTSGQRPAGADAEPRDVQPTRRSQAVETQKHLREIYEAAQRQQAGKQQPILQLPADDDDDIAPYRRVAVEEPAEAATQSRQKHHIDEIEEERCEEAEKVRQERRKQELRERFGAPAQRAAQKPKTLTQAARQLYAPAPPAQDPPPQSAPPPKQPLVAAFNQNEPYQSENVLVQGVIMAEILGPPRSKRSWRM